MLVADVNSTALGICADKEAIPESHFMPLDLLSVLKTTVYILLVAALSEVKMAWAQVVISKIK